MRIMINLDLNLSQIKMNNVTRRRKEIFCHNKNHLRCKVISMLVSLFSHWTILHLFLGEHQCIVYCSSYRRIHAMRLPLNQLFKLRITWCAVSSALRLKSLGVDSIILLDSIGKPQAGNLIPNKSNYVQQIIFVPNGLCAVSSSFVVFETYYVL